MPRINIYVPEALEACMRFHKNKNWSEIAQEAFRNAMDDKINIGHFAAYLYSLINHGQFEKVERLMANVDESGKREGAELFAQRLEEFVDSLIDVALSARFPEEVNGPQLAEDMHVARSAFVDACIKVCV